MDNDKEVNSIPQTPNVSNYILSSFWKREKGHKEAWTKGWL